MSGIATAPAECPSCAEIEQLALEYNRRVKELEEAKEKARLAAEPVDKLESQLIDLVRQFGSPHAQKSKILFGITFEVMGTFGQSIAQDTAAVERLRQALVKDDQPRLLKRLFRRDVRWTFNPVAYQEVIKKEKLTARLKGILFDCFVTKDRSPVLDVRPKQKSQGGSI